MCLYRVLLPYRLVPYCHIVSSKIAVPRCGVVWLHETGPHTMSCRLTGAHIWYHVISCCFVSCALSHLCGGDDAGRYRFTVCCRFTLMTCGVRVVGQLLPCVIGMVVGDVGFVSWMRCETRRRHTSHRTTPHCEMRRDKTPQPQHFDVVHAISTHTVASGVVAV